MSEVMNEELTKSKSVLDDQQIVFILNEQKYSLNIDLVMAIEQNYVIIPVPDAPENVKGMINLRGEVVPVYSLRARFHLPEADTSMQDSQRLLIVNRNGVHLGIEVDDVCRIERLQTDSRKGVPTILRTDSTNYIGNVLAVNDQIVVEISVDNIMAESDWLDLEKIIEQHSGGQEE